MQPASSVLVYHDQLAKLEADKESLRAHFGRAHFGVSSVGRSRPQKPKVVQSTHMASHLRRSNVQLVAHTSTFGHLHD